MARESLLSILRLTSFHQAGGEGKKATAALQAGGQDACSATPLRLPTTPPISRTR